MNKKFSALRYSEFKLGATAVAAVGGAMALQPGMALAVPATGTGEAAFTITAGNAVWSLNNNITFSTTSNNWGFSEGSLNGTRTDAFDGVLSWMVAAGAPGPANGYRSPGGTIDISPNFPTVSTVATTATGTSQPMAGLNVSGQIYFDTNRAVARSILILQNPTGAPITVNVRNGNNLGSDNNTTVQMTSSGDAVTDPTDNWVVSSQGPGPVLIPADPVLTMAFQNTGAAVRTTPFYVTGNDNPDFVYNVTVPAGQTVRVMIFVEMSATVAGAEASAATYNSPAALVAAGLLNGLSTVELNSIVNWSGLAAAAGGVGSNVVPAASNWALAFLAGLLGLFGLGSLVGRRREPSTTA